jgi:hypothetical protein
LGLGSILGQFFKAYISGKDNQIVSALENLLSFFSFQFQLDNVQNDAHELLVLIIDRLDSEYIDLIKNHPCTSSNPVSDFQFFIKKLTKCSRLVRGFVILTNDKRNQMRYFKIQAVLISQSQKKTTLITKIKKTVMSLCI